MRKFESAKSEFGKAHLALCIFGAQIIMSLNFTMTEELQQAI
jgi:hypothetical protein